MLRPAGNGIILLVQWSEILSFSAIRWLLWTFHWEAVVKAWHSLGLAEGHSSPWQVIHSKLLHLNTSVSSNRRCIDVFCAKWVDLNVGLGMSSGKPAVWMDLKDHVCVLLGMGNAVYSSWFWQIGESEQPEEDNSPSWEKGVHTMSRQGQQKWHLTLHGMSGVKSLTEAGWRTMLSKSFPQRISRYGEKENFLDGSIRDKIIPSPKYWAQRTLLISLSAIC